MNRITPVAVLADLPAHHIEIELLQGTSYVTYTAVAYRPVIDRAYRGDLRACTAQDKLIANVKLGAVYSTLDNGYPKLVTQQGHNCCASYPFQYILGYRGRISHTSPEHEEVLGRAFRHVALGAEHDRLIKAV